MDGKKKKKILKKKNTEKNYPIDKNSHLKKEHVIIRQPISELA